MIVKLIYFKLLISPLKLDILRKYIYLMPIKLRKSILVLLDLGCLTLSIYLSFYFCYYSPCDDHSYYYCYHVYYYHFHYHYFYLLSECMVWSFGCFLLCLFVVWLGSGARHPRPRSQRSNKQQKKTDELRFSLFLFC